MKYRHMHSVKFVVPKVQYGGSTEDHITKNSGLEVNLDDLTSTASVCRTHIDHL